MQENQHTICPIQVSTISAKSRKSIGNVLFFSVIFNIAGGSQKLLTASTVINISDDESSSQPPSKPTRRTDEPILSGLRTTDTDVTVVS